MKLFCCAFATMCELTLWKPMSGYDCDLKASFRMYAESKEYFTDASFSTHDPLHSLEYHLYRVNPSSIQNNVIWVIECIKTGFIGKSTNKNCFREITYMMNIWIVDVLSMQVWGPCFSSKAVQKLQWNISGLLFLTFHIRWIIMMWIKISQLTKYEVKSCTKFIFSRYAM